MDSIQAAILNIKIKRIAHWIRKRREIAEIYNRNLINVKELELPGERKGAYHSYHLYVVKSNKRDQLADFLMKKELAREFIILFLCQCYPVIKINKINHLIFLIL